MTSLDVRSGSNPEFELTYADFRFTPESGLNSDIAPFPTWLETKEVANSGDPQRKAGYTA